MNDRRLHIVNAAILAAMLAAAVWALAEVGPHATVPIHFNARGEADNHGPAWLALFLLPAIAALNWGLFKALPKIDPRGGNLARSQRAFGTILLVVTGVLAAAHAMVVTAAVGIETPLPSMGTALVGVVLVVTGNVLGKLRWNYTVGIRTPWTIADERVWDKTHRFGGRAFVLGGLLLVAAGFVPALRELQGGLTIAVALAILAATTLKSYLLWRATRPKE